MSQTFIKSFSLSLFLLLSLLLSTASHAQSGEKSSLWLNVGGLSWHFEDRNRFNQTHPALGFEYRVNDEWAIIGGRYKNSVYEKSSYLGAAYTPWSWRHLRFGVAVGAADGYPEVNKGKWFGLLTPVVMYENGRFGANLLIIPTISESVTGALAIQFKFKLAEF